MSNSENPIEALHEIKSMMERSSRFLSLNGLSGVFAGTFALAGAFIAHLYISEKEGTLPYYAQAILPDGTHNLKFYQFFIIDALTVLFLSLGASTWLTLKKAGKRGEKVWTLTGRRLFWNMAIPLGSGALFCLLMIWHSAIGLVAPATLVFYGLALVNASKYTFDNVRYLGITQIILGLLAGIFIAHGLLFWALGFGLVHIVYGIIMYYKVERFEA